MTSANESPNWSAAFQLTLDRYRLLSKEKEEAEQVIKDTQKRVAQIEEKMKAFDVVMQDYAELTEEIEKPVKAVRNGSFDILTDIGKPLHLSAIHQSLQQRGITVGGQHPLNNLSAHLSQDKRFKGLGDGIWGLAAWELKPARIVEPQKGAVLQPAGPVVIQ